MEILLNQNVTHNLWFIKWFCNHFSKVERLNLDKAYSSRRQMNANILQKHIPEMFLQKLERTNLTRCTSFNRYNVSHFFNSLEEYPYEPGPFLPNRNVPKVCPIVFQCMSGWHIFEQFFFYNIVLQIHLLKYISDVDKIWKATI